MKLLYNQKENYIKHIEEYYMFVFELFDEVGRPEKAKEAYNTMISKRVKQFNEILNNGIDTGSIVKNIEQVADIAYDEESYNEGIEYAHHGKNYYFVVKRGKKDYLYDADLTLSRMQ